MPFTFRGLRRRYFWARDAYDGMRAAGGLSATMRAERQETGGFLVSSAIELGDDDAAVRFVVAMRPFLDPGSDFAYAKLLEHVAREGDTVSAQEIARLREAIDRNQRGDLPIIVDGSEHGAASLYDLIAKAGFFDMHVTEAEAFQRLEAVQLGSFVWLSFFSFAIAMLPIVQRLFEIAYDIERQSPPPLERRHGPCLYCRSTAGPFRDEEHVIPEALGNDEVVLPPGVVCDPCNRRIGALDQYLSEIAPIGLFRVHYVTHTKRGKLSKAVFRNATARRKSPRHVEFQADNPPAIIQNADGSMSLTLESKERFAAHKLARAVYKIGLGMLAFKAGIEKAMRTEYDCARDFVAGASATFPNTLLVGTRVMPRPTIETFIAHEFGGTFVSLSVFGVAFAFNLEATPQPDVARLPAGAPIQAFDLSLEPREARRRTQRRASEASASPRRNASNKPGT